MTRVELVAPDISCDHCIASIRKAVAKLPGVQWLAGDATAKTVTLEYDSQQTALAAIEGAMAAEGYPVAS